MEKIRRNCLYAKKTKNEYKFYKFWVNIIADMFSNMSRYNEFNLLEALLTLRGNTTLVVEKRPYFKKKISKS